MNISNKTASIWFWQTNVNPHIVPLAEALANKGYNVIYVSNETLSKERLELGWQLPKLSKVKFILLNSKTSIRKLTKLISSNSIHLTQGLINNGFVFDIQKILRKKRINYWIMMERIDERGIKGFCRNILYNFLIFYMKKNIKGFLAIGKNAEYWIAKKIFMQEHIYPFTYFLKERNLNLNLNLNLKSFANSYFRFIFVGQLIKRKGVDFFFNALAKLKNPKIEVWIVGSGVQENYLKELAKKITLIKFKWYGVQSMSKSIKLIQKSDCLVLPSKFDGWGAVVSEALIQGTPVICSDNCGSSVVVKASKQGSVFRVNDENNFIKSLKKQLTLGKWNNVKRRKLMLWAKCLGAKKGSEYLIKILNSQETKYSKPTVPWKKIN